MSLILFFFGLHEFSAKALIVFFCSFLCLSKETNQRKDTTPKNSQILLSHFPPTSCHAKFGVHTGRGLPTALLTSKFELLLDAAVA